MPSFDIVSELNKHEVCNAVDQANREVVTRFDFKDSGATFDYEGESITLQAQIEFQLKQMLDILQNKFTIRNIGVEVGDNTKISHDVACSFSSVSTAKNIANDTIGTNLIPNAQQVHTMGTFHHTLTLGRFHHTLTMGILFGSVYMSEGQIIKLKKPWILPFDEKLIPTLQYILSDMCWISAQAPT